MGRLASAVVLFFSALTLSCGELPNGPRQQIVLTGTITDPTGSPLSGVTLYFRASTYEYYYEKEVSTLENGTFQIELPVGEYRVHLSRIGYVSRDTRVTVSSGGPRFDYRFDGATISGSMSGPGGAPISDVAVLLYGPPGAGYAEVTGSMYSILAPLGCYSMEFRPSTLGVPAIRWPQVCVTSDTTLPAALDGYLVTGTVNGRGNVGRVHVAAFYGDGGWAAQDYTDGAGTYSLLLPAGNFKFVATPTDSTFIAPHSRGLTAITGPMTLDWDLTGTEWSGIVRFANTLAPAPASVLAHQVGSYAMASSLPEANGAFRLILQPGYIYDLEAWSAGNGYWGARGIAAGADSTLNILLSGYASPIADPDGGLGIANPGVASRPSVP